MGNGTEPNGVHKFFRWANNISTVTKAVTGVIAIAGFIVAGLLFYMPRHEASMIHSQLRMEFDDSIINLAQSSAESRKRLSEYDEAGKLETDIDLKRLQIKQINSIAERRALTSDEIEELELSRASLNLLQQRLRQVQQQMRENDAI